MTHQHTARLTRVSLEFPLCPFRDFVQLRSAYGKHSSREKKKCNVTGLKRKFMRQHAVGQLTLSLELNRDNRSSSSWQYASYPLPTFVDNSRNRKMWRSFFSTTISFYQGSHVDECHKNPVKITIVFVFVVVVVEKDRNWREKKNDD